MDNVRKFWLENQDGAIWHFTDEESNTFLNVPAGLGLAVDYAGFRLGNAEIVNYQEYQLNNITGTLLFYKNNRAGIYDDYFKFMQFISKNSLLKLHYQTPNDFNSYYCYCFVAQIDKGELDNNRAVMQCPITFKRQTFWRNDNKNIINIENVVGEDGKHYTLQRPYYYAPSKLNNIRILNKGNAEATLKLTIFGEVTNPTFKIFDNNNNQYGAMRMLGTFDEVMIDSDDLNENIVLKRNGAIITAPYGYQDLSIGSPNQIYVTFIKVKSGASMGVFTYDGIFTGSLRLEWSDEYASI